MVDLVSAVLNLKISVWHYLLITIIIALILRKKELLGDWGPFFGFWVIYDMTRGIADNLSKVHIREVYDLESYLFGWMFNGQIPSEWAQDHQNQWITILGAIVYSVHPIAPLSTALVIYYVSKDQEMFREFKYAFILTIYLALLTFIFYPVAPPWYTYWHGFEQPQQQTGLRESAANLVNVDKFFSTSFFGDFYKTFNSNPYAAVPSLHAAFAFFAAYYLIKKYRQKSKLIWTSILYPMSVWFTAVYLNHHYVVDIIAGVLYSYVSIRFVRFYQERKKYTPDITVDSNNLDQKTVHNN